VPFEISLAPEVFQRRWTHGGAKGVEVVADVVIGFGDTMEAAAADHNKNLRGLLSRFEQHNV